MTSESDEMACVLVVEDEANLLELYEVWLGEEYTVRTATGGTAALDRLDSGVDAMVLDRRMPDVSGDALLRQVREEGCTCPVGLVSAAEPDFDLLELGFDAHLSKPVKREQLTGVVARLLEVGTLEPEPRALYQRLVKHAVLEESKSLVELEANEAYTSLETGLQETMASMDVGRVESVMRLVP